MLISSPVGFELGLGAELGKSHENESSMLIEAAEASVANEVMYTEAVKPKIEKQNIEVNANAVLDYDSGPRGSKEVDVDILSSNETEKCTTPTVELPVEQATDILPLGNENGSYNNRNIEKDTSVALVYATAALKYCPHSIVDEVTLDAISKIFSSKEHLRNNISSFQFGNIRNRPMYRGAIQYMHEVEFSLKVMKNKLWEPARSYVWKNLGTSCWTLHDGTEVTFNKIHQK